MRRRGVAGRLAGGRACSLRHLGGRLHPDERPFRGDRDLGRARPGRSGPRPAGPPLVATLRDLRSPARPHPTDDARRDDDRGRDCPRTGLVRHRAAAPSTGGPRRRRPRLRSRGDDGCRDRAVGGVRGPAGRARRTVANGLAPRDGSMTAAGTPAGHAAGTARIRRAWCDGRAAALRSSREAVSWIAVVAGLLQEYALREPVIGLPQLAAFVLAGVLAARLLAGRLGLRWPLVSLGLIASGAARSRSSWCPRPRTAVDAGGLQGLGARSANPGGLFAGLAVLRGFSHARQPLREDTLGRMFGGGVVAIAFAAMAGGLVAEPWRSRYLAEVLTDSLVFVATAVLALALTRQSAIGPDSQVDWPRNPAWVGLLVLLVAIVVVLAVPAAAVAPTAIDLAIAILLAPLLIIGLVAGWTRSGARFVGIVLLAGGLLIALRPRLGAVVQPAGTGTAGPEASAATTTPDQSLLPHRRRPPHRGRGHRGPAPRAALDAPNRHDPNGRRRGADDRPPGGARAAPPRRPRLPFRRAPSDAVAAYRALLGDLDERPPVRRDPAETPAEHARRMRDRGFAGLSLDLLAADYALARFGDVRLTEREHRRAIARWRGLPPAARASEHHSPADPLAGDSAPPEPDLIAASDRRPRCRRPRARRSSSRLRLARRRWPARPGRSSRPPPRRPRSRRSCPSTAPARASDSQLGGAPRGLGVPRTSDVPPPDR